MKSSGQTEWLESSSAPTSPASKRSSRERRMYCAPRELSSSLGIRVLQEVPARDAGDIQHCLRRSAGLDESTIRRFLMYAGDDDFIRGDVYVRTFVADATGRGSVSAAEAENLVRRSAYELILSPRYLDHELWKYGLEEQHRQQTRTRRAGQDAVRRRGRAQS